MSKEIIVPTHWINGGNMIDRDELPSDHPESYYGYIKFSLKLKPENYGIFPDKKQEPIQDLGGEIPSELVPNQ